MGVKIMKDLFGRVFLRLKSDFRGFKDWVSWREQKNVARANPGTALAPLSVRSAPKTAIQMVSVVVQLKNHQHR